MNRYVIHCTKEQTKKALELGAPIELESEYYKPTENDFKLENPIACRSFTNGYHYAKCPTAEQIINWLEEQEEISDVHIYKLIQSWTFELYASNGDGANEHPLFQSRKEATLAAIDAALEYLIENKK